MPKTELKTEIKIDLPLFHRGKVRDVYDFGENFLIVSSDRVSAFDYILQEEIPHKGEVLNKLSAFWFSQMQDIIPNHIVLTDFDKFPQEIKKYGFLRSRSMIVKKAQRIDIECIVRGYLAGSGWKEYQNTKTVSSQILPAGLKLSSKLPHPIFTPSSKEESGRHDENINFDEMSKRIGLETAEKLKNFSIKLYEKAANYALSKGIIIADTKFEFGFYNGEIILIDEIFTPDSSRFWELSIYKEGISQESLDKQFIRDYLEKTNWDKNSPPPSLPKEIISKTVEKYINVYQILTGEKFYV